MRKIFAGLVAIVLLSGMASAQAHLEYKWRGFYSTVGYDYGMNLNRGANEYDVADTMSAHILSFTAGFQFRKEAGVGIGVSYVADPTGAFTQLPVYAELRSHFLRSRITPYTVVQMGYSLPVGASSEPPTIKITSGGLYFGIGVGARYAVERSFAIGIHADYKMLQSNKVERFDISNNPYLEDAVVMHLVSAGISLYF